MAQAAAKTLSPHQAAFDERQRAWAAGAGARQKARQAWDRHEGFMGVMGVVIVLLLCGLCFTVVSNVITIMNQKFPEPIAATAPATAVTASTATLHGFLNPNNNGGTQYFFEYGPSRAYGFSTVTRPGPEGTVGQTPVSAPATALKANTTYDYRTVAFYDEYAGGSYYSYGPSRSFHTAP